MTEEEKIKQAQDNIKYNTERLDELATIIPRDDIDRRQIEEERRSREMEIAKYREILSKALENQKQIESIEGEIKQAQENIQNIETKLAQLDSVVPRDDIDRKELAEERRRREEELAEYKNILAKKTEGLAKYKPKEEVVNDNKVQKENVVVLDEEARQAKFLIKLDEERIAMIKNGYAIDMQYETNYDALMKSGKLFETIDKLNELSQSSVNKESIVDFITNKEYNENIIEIEQLVKGDKLFKDTGENEKKFMNFLNIAKGPGNFATLSTALEDIEERLVLNGEKLNQSKNEKFAIEHTTSYSELEKSDRLLIVKNSIAALETQRSSLFKSKKEYETKLESVVSQIEAQNNVVEYTNYLLANVNALDATYRKLNLEPEVSEHVAESLRSLRDKIVIFRVKLQGDLTEFNELCRASGLKKIDISKEESAARVAKLEQEISELKAKLNKEEIKEEEKKQATSIFDGPGVIDLSKVSEEKEVKEEIVNEVAVSKKPSISKEDLLKSIQDLNPGILVEEKILDSGKKDVYLRVDDPQSLVLPDGFKYDEALGINNKVDEITPYTSIEVQVNKKVSENKEMAIFPIEEEVKEEKLDAEVEPTEDDTLDDIIVPTTDKVPRGKCRVIKTRRAIMAPYVDACLKFGAIGGVASALVIGAPALVPAAAIWGTVGLVGQAIYTKMVEAGQLTIKELPELSDNELYKEDLTEADVGHVIKKKVTSSVKKMLTSYKESRRLAKKREEEREKKAKDDTDYFKKLAENMGSLNYDYSEEEMEDGKGILR